MLRKARTAVKALLVALQVFPVRLQTEKSLRDSLYLLRNYINNHQQNISRNMGFKGHSGEVSDGNEEHAIENWKKKDLVIKCQRTWLTIVLVFCGR